jgi:Uncharacterised nucleotidyltransferase
MTPREPKTEAHLDRLAVLALCPGRSAEAVREVAALDPAGSERFIRLAETHHVVIRSLGPLLDQAETQGHRGLAKLLGAAIGREQERIRGALSGLERVCTELEAASCSVVVMKTLDHWPDFGSDLDLVTTGDETRVLHLLKHVLQGRRCMRTLADRIAHKRSFSIPGLREQVELHINRLGRVGEHIKLAARFIDRRQPWNFGGYTFHVPAPEERVMAAALERMYRHLYIRICDIANTAQLIMSGQLDYARLRASAEEAGIWPGVATYLMVVSDYAKKYRGEGLELPGDVIAQARFGRERMFFRGKYFRFPVVPHGLALYAHKCRQVAQGGDFHLTARLSLVPPLASIGALAHAVTGSSERVW